MTKHEEFLQQFDFEDLYYQTTDLLAVMDEIAYKFSQHWDKLSPEEQNSKQAFEIRYYKDIVADLSYKMKMVDDLTHELTSIVL